VRPNVPSHQDKGLIKWGMRITLDITNKNLSIFSVKTMHRGENRTHGPTDPRWKQWQEQNAAIAISKHFV
jgi:hypothetical protein